MSWFHWTQPKCADARTEQILAAETRLLYTNVNVAVGVTIAAATVLACLQWYVLSARVIIAWWAYILLVSSARFTVARRYWASSDPQRRRAHWTRIFVVLAGFAGAGWGAAGIFLYTPDRLTNQVFLTFVIGGMILGGVSVLAPRPEAFVTFMAGAGAGPAARFLYAGDETHVAMGFLAAVFTIATIATTFAIHRTIQRSLLLRFDNQELVRQLESEKARAEALSEDLEIRVQKRTAELEESNLRLRSEIAHREQMEEELLRARKLEALGVLAGGIAHDFNNLLTVVSGYTHLLKRRLASGAPVEDYIEPIASACESATSLSSQLLTFAKGGTPVRRVVAIGDLLRDAVRLARAGSALSFDVSIPDDLWNAEVDPGQINQVLYNILLNARQAMSDSGIVEVRAENRPQEDPNTGPGVRIAVRDYGCGIPADVLPRIFDPYFTTKSGGSGLGLATAFSIIKKHGGNISVQSTPGQGSVFTIDLPATRQRAEPEAEPPRSVAPEQQATGRVLVMDDEDAVRQLLETALTGAGFEVESARDGAEAIALCEVAMRSNRAFDAVLLDVTVRNGMGGLEAAAKIRELDPDARLIVSSGYSDSQVMADYASFGFHAVLPKPWSTTELNEVFRRVIVGDRVRKHSK